MKNINSRYKREREVAKLLGLTPVPYSGSRWQLGKEDAYSEEVICQIKSTQIDAMRVRYRDLFDLVRHGNGQQVPVLVLDFVDPKIGQKTLPDDVWVAIRLEDFLYMLDCKKKMEAFNTEGEKFFG